MLVSGGRGVGKIEFTTKRLKGKFTAPQPERNVWCYPKHQQDLFQEIMKMNVEYMEGISRELDKYSKKNKRDFIILDDLTDEVSNSLQVTQLARHGRHDTLSVIYLTQNLLHKSQGTLSFNSDYMLIFKNPWDNSQFAFIARQIFSGKVKFLMWTYKDATSSSHTYLMLYLKPDTQERFRMSSNILKDPQNAYITHWKRTIIICKITMVLPAILRALRRICICW